MTTVAGANSTTNVNATLAKPDPLLQSSIGGGAGVSTTHSKKSGQRIFISGANSLLGHSLFDELRNDHIAIQADAQEEAHKFFVSTSPASPLVPVPSPSTMRVLNHRNKPKMFKFIPNLSVLYGLYK